MSCIDLEQLEHFAADRLEPSQRDAVQAHLEVCADCRQQLAIVVQNERLAKQMDDLLPEANATVSTPQSSPPVGPDLSGKTIGLYRIVRELGRGGMGVVYEAEQPNPKRTVALKVVRPGHWSSSAVKRFDLEAQVLGRLQHAGIAQIYEAGTADTGFGPQPYFAMELIRGATLRDFIQNTKLGTREKLKLIARICDAVHYAHQQGVIHRDLKPGNILVDAQGQPKILDFGVARATDSDVQLTTMHTDVGKIVGTLQYMSPEQAAADPNDLDTRSDVYALGVITYEVLTGHAPYDLRGKMIHEAVRIIREDEVTPMSTMNRAFRGDVETIVSTAVAKDKSRRYGSAAELASDIRRYLRDEPIMARPASALYQFNKFARRNRALVGGLAGIALAILIGFITSTFLYLEAERRRAEAATQRDLATQNEQRANDEAESARTEAAKAQAMTQFLVRTLTSADPKRDGRSIRLYEVLDRAGTELETAFPDQPEVELALRIALSVTYEGLGLTSSAIPHEEWIVNDRRQTLGAADPQTLHHARILARLYATDQRIIDARALLEESLEIAQRTWQPGSTLPGDILDDLGLVYQGAGLPADAESFHRQALDWLRQHLGENHPSLERALIDLGGMLATQRRYGEAEATYLQALELRRNRLGPEHLETLRLQRTLAFITYAPNGKLTDAEALLRETIDALERTLVTDDPETLQAKAELAEVLTKQQRYPEALELLTYVIDKWKERVGPYDGALDAHYTRLADLHLQQDHQDEAREATRKRLAVLRWRAEQPNPGVKHLNDYAWVALDCQPEDLRDPVAGLKAIEQAVSLPGGRNHVTLDTLALAYDSNGRLDEALAVQREAVEATPPTNLFGTIELGKRLVRYARQSGDPKAIEEACELTERKFRDLVQHRRSCTARDQRDIALALVYYGLALLDHRKLDEAETAFQECLQIRKKVFGEDNGKVGSVMVALGEVHLARGAFEQAEALMLEGERLIREDQNALYAMRRRAIDSLVKLYHAWAKPDEEARWRDSD